MRHQCTACWRDFSDDSGSRPEAERVHCVFCGARIASRRKGARTARISAVPFSKDVQREDAFALGVIGGGSSGFPDTLRQFRVRPAAPRPGDTLIPISQGMAEPAVEDEPLRTPWRSGSFWASLAVGLAVGVAVASAATAVVRRDKAAAPASAAPVRAAVAAPVPAPVALQPASPAALPPSCVATPVTTATVPAKPRLGKAPSAVLDRRWLLERARGQQREYRLGEAERLYRQVLTSAPRDSEALAGLGEVDLLRGSADVADQHFKQALEVNSDYIPALIAVADLEWQSGKGREAQQQYRRIVESYAADLYPPYVAQRSEALVVPDCGQP